MAAAGVRGILGRMGRGVVKMTRFSLASQIPHHSAVLACPRGAATVDLPGSARHLAALDLRVNLVSREDRVARRGATAEKVMMALPVQQEWMVQRVSPAMPPPGTTRLMERTVKMAMMDAPAAVVAAAVAAAASPSAMTMAAPVVVVAASATVAPGGPEETLREAHLLSISGTPMLSLNGPS